MLNDPTGELEDDNPIDEDFNGNQQDVEVQCAYCGQPMIVAAKFEEDVVFCDEECERMYYKSDY